ncbi:ABC transporter permease [Silvibacterium acidisoli]|uniref:ABC transporter permease n=1 Tax=Acidobacteriaceae bacterium ZG23-2 TaxID=2883246 RepID=UPI00406C90B4
MLILSSFRTAVRHLRKAPGFSLLAIGMLAVGIGATTSIFSIVEAVLLRPLPFADPGRLVVVGERILGDGDGLGGPSVTSPEIATYLRDTHAYSSLGAYRTTNYELAGSGEPAFISGTRLSGDMFTVLGVQPLLGQVFNRQQEEQHAQLAVLSYSTWMSRFHGDKAVLGHKILLDRQPYEITAVMPRGFEFPVVPGEPNRSELWVPLSLRADELNEVAKGSWNYHMVGRLKPGMTIQQAQDDTSRVTREVEAGFPAFMNSIHIRASVTDLHDDTVGSARPLLRTLLLAVVVVLLIVCANLAGLLLVRAIRRRREVAVRLALGADSATVIGQTLAESLVLSVTGGLLGLCLATGLLSGGVKLLPDSLPRLSEVGLNWPVVGCALVLCILTGILCGLAPAFAAIRTSVNETLKEGGRTGSAGGGHARLRSTLVIGEIAVALVLLAASGLLLRSFQKMREVNLGFEPDHVLTAGFTLPARQYKTQVQINAFQRELLDRLRQLPGVTNASVASMLPADDMQANNSFQAEGYVNPAGTMNLVWPTEVKGDYLRAMHIHLLRGRLLNEADKADSQLVILVNRKLAEHYWPGQDPIGRRIHWGLPESKLPWLTVVGEVEDVKQYGADKDTSYQLYQPIEQHAASFAPLFAPEMFTDESGFIVLRSAMPPEQLTNALYSTVRSLDPQLALFQVQPMEKTVSEGEAARRFNVGVISSFAGIAVILAVLGIYSVIAFSVALRSQEMAIRMALGSQRQGIVKLVVGSGAKLAAVGCALGLAGAFAASSLLRSLLFGVSAYDPLVLAGSAAAVLLLALIASALPAMRAAAIEPVEILRSE